MNNDDDVLKFFPDDAPTNTSKNLKAMRVRDLLIGREPKDWDITTNAKPAEIQALFAETFYEVTLFTIASPVSVRKMSFRP